MPTEISGLRIARSFITPDAADTAVERVLDFQLGARQGIAIAAVLPTWTVAVEAGPISSSVQVFLNGNQTLHLESGSLETVPDGIGDDEDTIDSEVFMRQDAILAGNDDAATEFRASLAIVINPNGLITFPKPILTSRNITHRAIVNGATFDSACHVIIYYTFVEFTLAELGLILSRRT